MDLGWINACILLILGLNTLRDVISWIGVVPLQSRFSWLIYNRYDEQVIERALKRLGFAGRDAYNERVVESVLRQLGFERRDIEVAASWLQSHEGIQRPFFQLLDLIHRNLFKFDRSLTYGLQTPIDSQFYINTMEAVHDSSQLVIMCKLLNALIGKHVQGPYPDFVLTPKTGNPVLGKRFAEMNGLLCLLRKDDGDTSRARFDREERLNNLSINFEGAGRLLAREKQVRGRNRPLHGIAIDCNASGGSAILAAMDEFNHLITAVGPNISPVKEACILFRPDNKDDVDARFGDHGYAIYRFLDLNEDVKQEIYRSRISDALREGDFGELTRVTKVLLARKLVKTEISLDELG